MVDAIENAGLHPTSRASYIKNEIERCLYKWTPHFISYIRTMVLLIKADFSGSRFQKCFPIKRSER